MLVPLRSILEAAKEHRFACGAFNVNSVAQIKAAVKAHEMFRAPAILQGAELANGFMSGRADFGKSTLEDKAKGAVNIVNAIKKYGEDSPIPIAIHLDHGKSLDSVKAVIKAGYTSVMIDGSDLPFEQNIELTREVVKYAHPLGVSVEGELGVLAGVEDHVFSASSTYTNPLDALEFVKKTKVDALAISYGTMHGANKGANAVLRKEIAIAINEIFMHEGIFCMLVSHGSSTVPQYIVKRINELGGTLKNAYGIPLEQLKQVSKWGIGKINVDTDIRLAITRNMREMFEKDKSLANDETLAKVYDLLQNNTSAFDPRLFLSPLMQTVTQGDIANENIAKLIDCVEMGVYEIIGTLIVEFGQLGMAEYVKPKTLEQMAEFYKKEGI